MRFRVGQDRAIFGCKAVTASMDGNLDLRYLVQDLPLDLFQKWLGEIRSVVSPPLRFGIPMVVIVRLLDGVGFLSRFECMCQPGQLPRFDVQPVCEFLGRGEVRQTLPGSETVRRLPRRKSDPLSRDCGSLRAYRYGFWSDVAACRQLCCLRCGC